MDTFNILSLCSGYGGLELGLRIAVPNARTVCYVEREMYPCAILEARMQEWADKYEKFTSLDHILSRLRFDWWIR